MNSEDTEHRMKRNSWKMRIVSLVCVGVGVLSALFCIGLLWAVKDMGNYYFVPHCCEALECQHPIKQDSDGRTYCSAFPPIDVKMAQVPMSYVRLCQAIVGVCGIAGLGCAGFTIIVNLLQAVGIKRRLTERWGMGLRIAAFTGALGLPFLALFFLWPYGIVPM